MQGVLILKRIILTGGGTAGHVTPNIALIPKLKKQGFEIIYIGSYNGIEKKLVEDVGIKYYGISSGKLRRYFDVKNFTDPIKIIKGYYEASKLIKVLKPSIVFSKGGFVTVPVVVAAKRRGIPCVIHESDMTPGLANKISIPFSSKVCASFPEALNHLPNEKAVLTGTPIREELFLGNRQSGLSFCNLNTSKPVLLIIGGSLGSVKINNIIRSSLRTLLNYFQIIHLCGKGNLEPSLYNVQGYTQFEYVNREMSNVLASADMVISRAGANTISELLALRKLNILIPLSAEASRGDQILNAKSFENQGFSLVLNENNLTQSTLMQALNTLYTNRNKYIHNMSQSNLSNGVNNIISCINNLI